MPRIFISYKRADKEKIFAIKDKIEAATGEKCWIDLDSIESDAQFANVIIKAIDEADIFLFMYSKLHSKIKDYEKDWTVREINYAQAEGKRIVFVNIDKTPLTKWFKFMFSSKQQVDATSEDVFNHLLRDMNKWLTSEENNPNSATPHNNSCNIDINTTLVSLKKVFYKILFIIPILTIIALISHFTYKKYQEINTNDKVRDFVELYRDATNNNNIEKIEELYAPEVKRFYNSYNISRESVVNNYKKYADVFKAHNPQSAIQWETLRINIMKDGYVNISFVEYYSLDREEDDKNSMWILEKHFVLNEDFKIVKEHEVQMKKGHK